MRAQNYIPPFSHRGEEKTHSFKAVGFFDNAGTKREERLVACSIFGWVDRMINSLTFGSSGLFLGRCFFHSNFFGRSRSGRSSRCHLGYGCCRKSGYCEARSNQGHSDFFHNDLSFLINLYMHNACGD